MSIGAMGQRLATDPRQSATGALISAHVPQLPYAHWGVRGGMSGDQRRRVMAIGPRERAPLARNQYGSIHGSQGNGVPEKRLLAAVLMNALVEYERVMQRPARPNDPCLDELRAWFFGRDVDWPFAFENLCSQLDLDPDCIRGRLGLVRRGATLGEVPVRRAR